MMGNLIRIIYQGILEDYALHMSFYVTGPNDADDVSIYCKGDQINETFELTSTRLFEFLLSWQS